MILPLDLCQSCFAVRKVRSWCSQHVLHLDLPVPTLCANRCSSPDGERDTEVCLGTLPVLCIAQESNILKIFSSQVNIFSWTLWEKWSTAVAQNAPKHISLSVRQQTWSVRVLYNISVFYSRLGGSKVVVTKKINIYWLWQMKSHLEAKSTCEEETALLLTAVIFGLLEGKEVSSLQF